MSAASKNTEAKRISRQVAVTIETVWSQKEPKNSHPDSARQIRQLALVAYDVGHGIRDLNLAAIIDEVKGRET